MSFSPWIKIEDNTPDKPEVVAMAARLRMKDPDTVTGKLVRLWAWANRNSIDGHAISITRAFIDRLTACKGFAAAMEAVGWLEGKDGLLSFPGFDRHNGDSAKKRASETRKKQGQRERERRDKPGTNVPPVPGQKPGPEIEGELGERESGREAPGIFSAAELALLLSLRPEWQAAPVLSPAEAEAFERNLPALRSISPATWDAMRRFMGVRFPEGDARFQPRRRLLAIHAIGDLAAQAVAWQAGAGGVKPAVEKPWPETFETWAKERFPSTPPRVLWLSAAMREQWESSGEGGEEAA